jgi:ABC-type glycerol-3-phosphate transport system permease component
MDMHDNAGQPDTSDTYLHWGRRETLQAMAAALLVMLPPLLLVIFMQRWFVRGLIAQDK